MKKNQQVEHKHKNNDQKQWRNLEHKTEKKKKNMKTMLIVVVVDGVIYS